MIFSVSILNGFNQSLVIFISKFYINITSSVKEPKDQKDNKCGHCGDSLITGGLVGSVEK